MTTRKNIALLYGGFSSERPVSLESGKTVGKALMDARYDVTLIDVTRDLDLTISALTEVGPDVVFNALHGRFGEDGGIQSLLETMMLPYTHSGPLASAVAMNKPLSKVLFEKAGIPTALHVLASKDEVLAGDPMDRPFVVKPVDEGSSVGVVIAHPGQNTAVLDRATWPFGETVMVEQYIPGRELTVGVQNGRAIGVTEILTDHSFYDFDAKYAPNGSRHIVPARIPNPIAENAMDLAERAYDVIGCKGVARADFRLDGNDLYILELNTQPGMTETSLVPEQAASIGISFQELVSWMVEDASCNR